MRIEILGNVIDYNKYVEGKEEYEVKEKVRQAIAKAGEIGDIKNINYYYFDGTIREKNYVGNKTRLYILANATKYYGDVKEHQRFGKILPSNKDMKEIIIDGEVVANYSNEEDCNFLNILIDTIRVDLEGEILTEILLKLKEMLESQYQWNEDNKEGMLKLLERELDTNSESEIRRLKEDINNYNRNIEEAKERIISYIRSIEAKSKRIRTLENTEDNIAERLSKDFDLIMKLDKIKDFKIVGTELLITTIPLNFFDMSGNEYLGGEFTFKIQTKSGAIKITSSRTVHGGWGEKDPHPHVSGETNNPCFGNTTSTIAELIGQNEYYALTIILLNFITSVDTTDVVGAYAYRWGRVVDGEVIYQKGRADVITVCDFCGENITEEDDRHTGYHNVGDAEVGRNVLDLCTSCIESSFTYNSYCREHVQD